MIGIVQIIMVESSPTWLLWKTFTNLCNETTLEEPLMRLINHDRLLFSSSLDV